MRDKSNYKHYENVSIMLQMETLTFQAESVAFVVSTRLGLDVSAYSMSYIQSWLKDKQELKIIADTVQKVSCRIINLLAESKDSAFFNLKESED